MTIPTGASEANLYLDKFSALTHLCGQQMVGLTMINQTNEAIAGACISLPLVQLNHHSRSSSYFISEYLIGAKLVLSIELASTFCFMWILYNVTQLYS